MMRTGTKPLQIGTAPPVGNNNNNNNVEPPKGEQEHNYCDWSSEQLVEHFGSKSGAIRGLHEANYIPAKIAKLLGIRYQHAYNVINTPLKRTSK